jgi:hypothetical protein
MTHWIVTEAALQGSQRKTAKVVDDLRGESDG